MKEKIHKLLLSCLAIMLGMTTMSACERSDVESSGKKDDSRVLQITPLSIQVGYEASEYTFKLSVNFDYDVNVNVDWVDVKSASSSELVLEIGQNTSPVSREAELKVVDRTDRYYFRTVKIVQDKNPVRKVKLSIVDKNATEQTKALYANLWKIAEDGFMFGHHDDLWYGRYWYNEPGGSDTKAVCGDYPAVFSVDFASLMDNRYKSDSKENEIRRRVILEARERGEIITACAHLNNPLTIIGAGSYPSGSSWDNTKCIDQILKEGTEVRKRYIEWLDRLADFANSLKDKDGNLIPILFRPYHECTQSWSWWGTSACTSNEFVQLWRWTVKYLRDTRNVHNFLYAVSPQMDGDYGENARERLLTRWPGDDYVDFLGMDCYHGLNYNAFATNIDAMQKLSVEKMKPCGVTETGAEAFRNNDYWTRYILDPAKGKHLSMVVMWRNKYVSSESDTHWFSVYPGHPSEDDFRVFYADEATIFSADLPDMYTMPDNYEVE